MEIKVDAQVALNVLMENGIDMVQAKAIIFDLQQASSDTPLVVKQQVLKPQLRTTPVKVKTQVLKREVTPAIHDEESATEEEEETVAVGSKPTNKSKRVSFAQFGGAAESPTWSGA